MRTVILLPLVLLAAVGCSSSPMTPLPKYDHRADYHVPGTRLSVTVILRSAHPFLNEWCRAAALADGERCAAWTPLLASPGGGSLANLYRRPDGVLVLIDMNGRWFGIDANRRSIAELGWRWEEPAPGPYLGCFAAKEGHDFRTFAFIPATERPEQSPYWVKDPEADGSTDWK